MKDPVEYKILKTILPTFELFSNGRHDIPMPFCDEDKQIIKSNMRKLDLFDTAYRFCDEIFDFNFENLLTDLGEDGSTMERGDKPDGWLDSPMNESQLEEVSSAFLSIVLSTKIYQKHDVMKIMERTKIDIPMVRNTMQKYSK